MIVQLTAKKRSKHFIPNFEMHSLLLFAALAMAAATAAQAQTAAAAPAKPNSSSVQIAASTAGTIPPNKAASKDLEAAFKRADTNRDGKLSHQETEHFPALAHRFEQVDTDHNSFLSRDEFNQAAGS